MGDFKADLSSAGGFLEPTQEMANFTSLKLARGRSKVPAYTPFIAPDVSAAPWAISSKEHDAAVSRWRTSSRVVMREDAASSIPTQAWLLYRLRFVIAADLAGAWSAFGGMAAQLNHLSIIMNISITDSAAIALSYDRLVREFLAEKDRSRQEVNSTTYFADFLSVGNPALKIRAMAEHPRPTGGQKGAGKDGGKLKKDTKKDPPQEHPAGRTLDRSKGRSKIGRIRNADHVLGPRPAVNALSVGGRRKRWRWKRGVRSRLERRQKKN